jgi:hypothetical protein
MNIPSTQITTRCDSENAIHEKTLLEGDDYAFLSFFSVMKCKYKEMDTHYGVSKDIVA